MLPISQKLLSLLDSFRPLSSPGALGFKGLTLAAALTSSVTSLASAGSGTLPLAPQALAWQQEAQAPVSYNYYGGGIGLGQSRSNGQENMLTAYQFSAEAGHSRTLGSWSSFEAAAELTSGFTGHSQVHIQIPYGLLAHVGYGYSLGNRLLAVWRLGAGILSGRAEVFDSEGHTYKPTETLLGSTGQIGFAVHIPIENVWVLTGGIRLAHQSFHMGQVRADDGSTRNLDRPVELNVLTMNLGLRRHF